MTLVVGIESLRKTDVLLAGGKGASLGELVSAGVNVPPGFVVTSEAYRAFLRYNGLEEEVRRLDFAEREKALSLAPSIREKILAGSLPKELEKAVENHAIRLAGSYVAVRSSATFEDSPDFSFAGIHDTYLGVPVGNVVEYVKRVWASNFTERSIAYKLDNKIPPSRVFMAVVVQRLVNPKAAGVAFSLNPTSGDRSVVAIESSWGLGEAVVAGEVNPDRFIVSKVTMDVVKREVSPLKAKRYVLRGGKVVEEELDPQLQSAPSLTDEEAVRVASEVLKLEKYYGYPVDVEWALDDRLYILQVRPETVWSRRGQRKWESTGDIIRDIVNNLLSIKIK